MIRQLDFVDAVVCPKDKCLKNPLECKNCKYFIAYGSKDLDGKTCWVICTYGR